MKLHGQIGKKTAYENLQNRLLSKYRLQAQSKLCSDFDAHDILSIENLTLKELKFGKPLIINTAIEVDDLYCTFDALKKISLDSNSSSFQYVPVLYLRDQQISTKDKVLLAFKSYVLSRLQTSTAAYGHIVYGRELRDSKIHLDSYIKKAKNIIDELTLQASSESDDNFFLDSHCEMCEFSEHCKVKITDRNCLSLLRNMSLAEIRRQNGKGIFTVNQLSYTFRPKKTPKRAKNPSTPRHFSLQALALRENKIYIHGIPPLTSSDFPVFFDIEGIPQRQFYYLIGLLTVEGNQPVYRNFWANNEQDQVQIFNDFLTTISGIDRSTFYHFGNYDVMALKQFRCLVAKPLQDVLDTILSNSQNLLSVIYPHVYFPTYTNKLKDIGRFLGCKWTEDNPSGIQSIILRETWEETFHASLKERLILYNKEDCLALKRIYDFLVSLAVSRNQQNSSSEELFQISNTADLKQTSYYSKRPPFGKAEFLLDDLEFANRCAYFDYQREKVFIRTHRHFNKRKAATIISESKKHCKQRLNSYVKIESTQCAFCGRRHIKKGDEFTRDITDLKFSKTGVKRWIQRYISWHYHCKKCGHQFISPGWPKGRTIFGHGIMSWCVYQNVLRGQNMLQVSHGLKDIFSIAINNASPYRFKNSIAAYYRGAYREILSNILNSSAIHIDETSVRLKNNKGYVWVLTNMNMVYYFYRESREGSFLKDLLHEFEGVLISDFYTAYDSIDCPQQKCLVHLMRDINDTLKKNPFDDDFKTISVNFGKLLRSIVNTIDHYGLKKRNLHKHKKDALRFIETVSSKSFSSKIAQKLQVRVKKAGMKLFTFLDHDGIPWNNNNAERNACFCKDQENFRLSLDERLT
jgi:predicted RecB family nuclease